MKYFLATILFFPFFVIETSEAETINFQMIEVKDKIIVSAYNVGDFSQTDDTPCIGAFGDNLCELLNKGIQPVASNYFPYKTKLYLEGIGEVIVLDRMHSRYYKKLDIAMGKNKKQEAINFGTKTLSYIIIK